MELKEALEAVVNEAQGGFAAYAKTYAQAALDLGGSENACVVSKGCAVEILHEKTGKMMVGEEMKVQILYVLSNLQYWKGERAKEVKKILKEASK